MQPPQLKPALAGTADVALPAAFAGPSMTYDGSSGKCENLDSNPRSCEEGDEDAGTYSADYRVYQQRPDDTHNATRRRSSSVGQLSVEQVLTSVAPLSSPPQHMAARTRSSHLPHGNGTSADRSASVSLPPAYPDRFSTHAVGDCPAHHGTVSSSWCCDSTCATRTGEANGKVPPEGNGCSERFSPHRIGSALLSSTAETAPGYLLALIGVVTGVLLFLPWSSNPVHIALMVLSSLVGCVCGLLYWISERRWYRRWRHGFYDASGAAAASCSAGGARGWHVESAAGSAGPRYHDHDADDEVSSVGMCCCAGCVSHLIDRQHFRVVLPTAQLLLLGTFVLVSPQVMATWTAPMASTTGRGGGAILADRGAGHAARYGATLYPVEAVWKTCLLHAWIGMRFSLPLLWSLLVGLVHMAVLLAQYQHAGPGTLLTLVVWMSVPLLCFAFAMCITRPRPAVVEEQQHHQLLRGLASGGGAAGYSASYGAGVGEPLPPFVNFSIGRRRDALEATCASVPYSSPSTVTTAAPAPATQYSAHPSRRVVLPPPPVAAYSPASYAQMFSAEGIDGSYLARLKVGEFGSLVRGGSGGVGIAAARYPQANYGGLGTAVPSRYESDQRLIAPQRPVRPRYNAAARSPAPSVQQGAPLLAPKFFDSAGVPPRDDLIGLATPHDITLPPQHGRARDLSAPLYSPSSLSQAVREARYEPAHYPINNMDEVTYPTTSAAAMLPSSGDGTHPSLPLPQTSRQLAPPSRLSIVSSSTPSTMLVSNLEPAPQPRRQRRKHVQQAAAGEVEEAGAFRDDAVDSDGAAAAIVPADSSHQKTRQHRRTGSATAKGQRTWSGVAATAAAAKSMSAAAPAADDDGCANGVDVPNAPVHGRGDDGEEWDSEPPIPAGTSLEDACAPYLVLDAALVIVDVGPSLCRLLGTTVDAVLFRRLPDVLAWLDVVERETAVMLVSAVAQPLRTAAAAVRGEKRGAGAHSTREEKAKKGKGMKRRHSGAQDGMRDNHHDTNENRNASSGAAKQLQKPSEMEVRDNVAEGAPVRRITLRGHCPYYAKASGSTREISAGRCSRRPPFALCFDVWAERLAAPAPSTAGSWRRHRSSAVGGGRPLPTPFVIILRRPLLHGLCDALPLPVALVHPRTGEVLCWNRYAARLTGCTAYDMLGTPAYGSFVYEGLPGAATTAASQGGFSSTGRHLPPPPPSPSVEFASSTHRRQQSSNTAALSAATAAGTVPDGEVASNGFAPPPVKSTSPTTAALLLSSQQTTSTAFSPLQNARLQRQHGGAGSPTFVDQASPPPHAAGLYGTFTVVASQQHRDTPLPGFFYVPCTRAAAAVAGVPLSAVGHSGELAMTTAIGGGGARPSSSSSTGGGPHQISSLQLPWSLAGRGGTVAAAAGHADRVPSQLTAASQSPLSFGVGGGGGDNKNSTSGVAVGARCPRPPPPPPLAAGLDRGTDPYDEAGVATAFETDGSKEAQGDGDEDVMAAPYCSSPVMVHGLLFRATLRPLRGVLCSEEGGVVENQLGGPLRTSASAVEGEHAGGRGAEGNPFFNQPPRAAHEEDSAAVEGKDAEEGQALARDKNMQAHGDDKSGSDDSVEALLSERQPHHRHHRLHRTAAGARMRNSECEEDSGAEDQSDMDDDDDDDTPFDEDDLPKAMAGTMNGGLTLAATLEQLFATKAMACNFGLDKEPAACPRRSAASTVTTTATAASGALLSSELLPQYSLREALQQLAASESPLLLTFSEPPLYATTCASAEALLQERRLSHHRVSSPSPDEHGYSGVLTHANNGGVAAAASGGDCTSVPESYLGTPQAPFLRRQRPQVPALWGDGSSSLQFVAAVKEAVDSYRESIEEDSSGYTDLLGLLSLSGANGGCCPSSGYAARNSSSSLTPTSFGGAPDAAVTTAITADAVRQLRLLKSLSDQLLQATAAYNRTRQSMSSTTCGLSGGCGCGGVAARVSPSSSSPSLSLGLFAAPSVPDADAAHERHLHARRHGSATTPSPHKDPPAGGPLGFSAHQSPFQPPPPPPHLAFTSEEARGAHRRLQGGGPHRRQPGEPAASASTGGSGAHTGIYRDPNSTPFSVASEDVTGVAPSAVGDSRNWALKEPPPPPHHGATRTSGSGGRRDIQDGGASPVKSRPRHAAKSSTASAPLKVSRGRHTGARHGRRGGAGAGASTPAPSPPLVPLDAAVDVAKESRSSGYMGEISGSTPSSASPCGVGGSGRTAAAAPAATSSLNASTLLVAAGSVPAMSTPRPHATGASASALDVATPQTELHSSPRPCDTVVASGEGEASGRGGGAGEDTAAAGGVTSRLTTSPRYQGSLLLSPSLAAAEMGELEASYGTESRQQRPQHRSSPNIISGAGSGSGATPVKRDASPRRRSSAVYRRESSLDVLPSAPLGSGSFRGNGGLVPTSSSASPSAGAGAGGQGTGSPSPHPARTGSGSLNANANAAAAATAAVRSTPRRPGEGAVWAVLVSRDEATIPSCCISVNLGDEFRLGRSSKCTAVVSDSFVSSTQFSIVRTVSASTTAQDSQSPGSGRSERGARRNKAFTVTLYDRSANGTYVNVKKLGKDKSCVLRDRALITFRLSTSQFFLGFVFMLTDERGVPLDDRTGMGGGSGLRSLLDARLSPQPQTGRRTNASSTGGGGKESSSSQNTVMASPNALSTSAARRNTPRALSTPDNSSFASGTPNGSRRAGGGAPRSSRHAHRETIEWKIGEEMLGKGGNAEVYLGINLTNGQLIAVKRVRLPTFAHGSDAEQDPEAKAILQQYRSLQEEISVLSKATHPNIVQYYGSSQNSTYFNILLEFVPGGSLRHLLDNFGALSPGVILSYVHQALEGLAYLHRHNIVHSDFKAANILITEKGKVKLTDFGTARLLTRPHATAARGGGEAQSVTSRTTPGQRKDDPVSVGAGGTLHIAGTLRWMDPALFHNPHSSGAADVTAAATAKDSSDKLGGPTKAGDIWSVGCTMIEMMSGEAPWFEYDFESEEQIVNLLTYTAEPPEIPECPECPDLVTIAQTCLKMDPARRPTCEELLRIVEEATARLQAQSTSPSVSPSREVSQQHPAVPGSVSGAGTGLRSSSTLLCPQMEPGTNSAFASLTANPAAAAYGPGTDDRRRAERVGRPSDSTPMSFAVGGDGGSSAPLSARDAALPTVL
ncbi:protein kinase, putative [Leishmania donovani]|uniref:Protein kinase, putative n=1 Tax=Leishmania donovani TaxID=5661 RepID=A0A3S5H5R5_LEIDO|nr:protein kinase, putative [Leishmania donovani]